MPVSLEFLVEALSPPQHVVRRRLCAHGNRQAAAVPVRAGCSTARASHCRGRGHYWRARVAMTRGTCAIGIATAIGRMSSIYEGHIDTAEAMD